MRMIETRNIPMDEVQPNPNQYREVFDKEIIEGMAKSIKKIGLTNPITVRIINDKYQLVAGDLRYRAMKLLDGEEIQAKIIEADDVEVDIISLTENFHRKDLDAKEREKSIYVSWKRGKAKGVYNTIADMCEATGIPDSTLQENIASGKEKEDKNNQQIKEIQEATAKELEKTRTLNKFAPKTRKEILHQSAIEKKLSSREIEEIVRAIKNSSDNIKTSDEVLKEIPKLVANKHLKSTETGEFLKNIAEIPIENDQIRFVENMDKEDKVDMYKVKTFVDAYIGSPPDIQKKLLDKRIDVQDAKVANKFHTKYARDQIIEERKILSDMKEKDIEKHVDIRIRQEKEVELSGDRKLGNLTKIDIDKILKDYEDSDENIDSITIENYRGVTSKIKKLFNVSTIKNIHTDRNKKIAVEFIRQVYGHCYEVLLEIGDIKVISNTESNIEPIIPKKLYS